LVLNFHSSTVVGDVDDYPLHAISSILRRDMGGMREHNDGEANATVTARDSYEMPPGCVSFVVERGKTGLARFPG
jgi:hypothetical protein